MDCIQYTDTYENIISVENLLEAWREFKRGKKHRADVQHFERNLLSHVLNLHEDLSVMRYVHDGYEAFRITDPKPRDIHKASVRDRLLHHAIYRKLYPFFDRVFISDSYSCRKDKGSHKALARFRAYAYKASSNHMRTVWILKCDIRKFFASIDHGVLVNILKRYIPDERIMWLFGQVIMSFNTERQGTGLPLGNLTSQLLVNVYMNDFDQFAKHNRYAVFSLPHHCDMARNE